MAEIQVALGHRSYPVIVRHGISRRLPEMLEEAAPSSRYFVVSDQNVWSHYSSLFPAGQDQYQVCAVAPGEISKSVDTLHLLWTFLLERQVERSHVVVAFGGGVVGDLAGFAAATVLRGIHLVQIPTTLLAQVDASIGGKTGINHPLGKNLLGAFYQPVAVLVDPDLLETLPQAEFQSGMYEVIKYALIEPNGLYDRLIDTEWTRRSELASIIEACVRCKAEVVAADEKEGGRRMILNLGHTLGHAIEAAGGFQKLTHGQAVGWGMLFAASLSRGLGICDGPTEQAIARLVRRNGELPRLDCSSASLVDAMRHDKKVRDGKFTFVLPRGIGDVVIQRDVPERLVRTKLEDFLQ
ncbi:MAG: 3-dehydroquinate synthase [Acidobacteria bacterium]|nr:3-dehydroquinate synthase [Acidobacteriota bacterium]